jgi:hypothetical protein
MRAHAESIRVITSRIPSLSGEYIVCSFCGISRDDPAWKEECPGRKVMSEEVEAEYHRKKPEDFDEVMEHAGQVSPAPRGVELDVATISGEYELGGRLTIEYAAPVEEWNDPGKWLVEDLLAKMIADAEHRAGVPFFKRSGIIWTRRKVETQE